MSGIKDFGVSFVPEIVVLQNGIWVGVWWMLGLSLLAVCVAYQKNAARALWHRINGHLLQSDYLEDDT